MLETGYLIFKAQMYDVNYSAHIFTLMDWDTFCWDVFYVLLGKEVNFLVAETNLIYQNFIYGTLKYKVFKR